MKRLILTIFAFSIPALAQSTFIQMPNKYPSGNFYTCGVPANLNPCSNLVSMFQDSGLTIPITQPARIGLDGNYGFWISSSTSQITIQVQSPYNQSFVMSGGGGGGGGGAFNTITPGTNTGTLVMGTGGSMTTSGLGQNVSNQDRWTIGPPQPSGTCTNTGGSLNTNQGIAIQFVFNNGTSNYTLPGQAVNGGVSVLTPIPGCTGGSGTGQIVLTAPTAACGALPCGGYTGYSVFAIQCGSPPCTLSTEQLVTTCQNITANCTVNAGGSGATVPATNTAYAFPSPLGTNLCSPGTNPFLFIQDSSGNSFPYMGVDNTNTGANPPSPYNKISVCRPWWFNDSAQDPPPGKNALVLFAHVQNGVTVNAANQDRALYSTTSNCLPFSTNCADSSSHYGLEGIQVEQDIFGTPTITGSPDGEVTAGSFQMASNASANYASNSFGTNGIRVSMCRGCIVSTASGDTQGMNGAYIGASNASNTSASGVAMNGIRINMASTIASASLVGSFIRFNANGATGTIPGGSFGVRADGSGSFAPTSLATMSGASNGNCLSCDMFFRNDQHNWAAMLNGPAWVNSVNNSDPGGILNYNDNLNVLGGIETTQLAAFNPSLAPSCSGGASQYTYKLVPVDVNGGVGPAQTVTTSSSCVNPLTGGNPVTIFMGFPNPISLGITAVRIFRTGGPMGTGLVGTFTCTASTPSTQSPVIDGCSANFVDNGLTADGGSVPTVNTSGGAFPAAYSALKGNKYFVSSNFTTANNTSLQTITGLAINVSPAAANYQVHCNGVYSQATAAVAVAFGIQFANVGPTNVMANGKQQIAAATAPAPQVIATATPGTTATNVTSGTPGATATNYVFDIDFSWEEPANDAGNVVNVMVSTATGTDAVTVLRDSNCYQY